MGAVALICILLAVVAGFGSLACFIMVLVKMFQNDQSTLAIVCIVLAICTGIGPLIAFVYGWIKSGEWGLKNVMLAWTGCIVATLLFYGIAIAAGFGAAGSMPTDTTRPPFKLMVQ